MQRADWGNGSNGYHRSPCQQVARWLRCWGKISPAPRREREKPLLLPPLLMQSAPPSDWNYAHSPGANEKSAETAAEENEQVSLSPWRRISIQSMHPSSFRKGKTLYHNSQSPKASQLIIMVRGRKLLPLSLPGHHRQRRWHPLSFPGKFGREFWSSSDGADRGGGGGGGEAHQKTGGERGRRTWLPGPGAQN